MYIYIVNEVGMGRKTLVNLKKKKKRKEKEEKKKR